MTSSPKGEGGISQKVTNDDLRPNNPTLVGAELHHCGLLRHKDLKIKVASWCDHDHWHRWLVWEPKRRCLWAPTRIFSGRHKDLRSCGDGSLYHHLCNPASCFCLKAEEQQRPCFKKQVCSPFSKFKRGKEPHWKPLPCCMKHTSLANTKYQIHIRPIANTKYQINRQYQIS